MPWSAIKILLYDGIRQNEVSQSMQCVFDYSQSQSFQVDVTSLLLSTGFFPPSSTSQVGGQFESAMNPPQQSIGENLSAVAPSQPFQQGRSHVCLRSVTRKSVLPKSGPPDHFWLPKMYPSYQHWP